MVSPRFAGHKVALVRCSIYFCDIRSKAVKLLTDHNSDIFLTNTYGNLIIAMHKVISSPTATSYRIAPYDTFWTPEKVIPNKKMWLIIVPPLRRRWPQKKDAKNPQKKFSVIFEFELDF